MLDTLSERLQGAFRRLGSRGKITDSDLDAALREVRVALLEADVNFQVVRDFIAGARQRALGADVTQSITPGQQVIGIVHEQLVEVLGGDSPEGDPLAQAEQGPTTILVCGVKGSGKTTLVARLALHLKNQGLNPLMVTTDFERVAAADQLQALGDQIDVRVYTEEQQAPPAQVGQRALEEANRSDSSVVIFDTRGAVTLDDTLADELAELADAIDATEVLIVVDAMTGQEAVTIAAEFDEALEGTGIVVTKVDSDTRGGAVLSVRQVTGLPVKFITTGERLEALETFHPDRFSSRVLGMGDIVTLVEKAQETLGERDTQDVVRRIRSGAFDLEDFLSQMQQVQKMGSLSTLMEMIPGVSGMQQQLNGVEFGDRFWKQSEAIIYSMTPMERRNPDILNGSRRRRIALGSGTNPAEVNRLLNQFSEAKKMMKAITGETGNAGRGKGSLGRMLGL